MQLAAATEAAAWPALALMALAGESQEANELPERRHVVGERKDEDR